MGSTLPFPGDTVKQWRCRYCCILYNNRNLTRLLGHLAGLAGTGIAACKDVPADKRDSVMTRAREACQKKKKRPVAGAAGAAASSSSLATQTTTPATVTGPRQLSLKETLERRENEEVRACASARHYCPHALSSRLSTLLAGGRSDR